MGLACSKNINKRLAVVALVLGILAIFVGNPVKGGKVQLDTENMAQILNSNADTISVYQLSDWIIQGKADFTIIDLRNGGFDEYRIPGAVNIKISELESSELMRNQKYILYSDDEALAAQAWVMLKAMDYRNVFRVKGGLKEWREKILNPDLPADAAAAQIKAFEKAKAVSNFFGGNPTIAGVAIQSDSASAAMPKPVIQAPAAVQKKPKLRKEGC